MRVSGLIAALGVATGLSLLTGASAFAADFEWKFNNGLPETRNESQ